MYGCYNPNIMGLKFRKFKAKLNWKTKETVPDVVCLRYHINSEFDEDIGVQAPATSSTQLRTSDVIKQKKPAPKPAVQSVFESKTSAPSSFTPNTSTTTNVNVNNINHKSKTNDALTKNQNSAAATIINHKSKTNDALTKNQNSVAATREPVPTKGILKKSTPDENVFEETKQNQNNTSDTDDYKKSALIFMTENHDDSEEPREEKHNTKETKELDRAVNAIQGITELNSKSTMRTHQEEETGEFRFSDARKVEGEITEYNFDTKYDERKDKPNSSDSESEHADVKTVRWRETILEINPPNLETDIQNSEDSADDFKVHFVKHISTTGLQSEGAETEESEPEDNDQPQMSSYYGNRGAYSSQAASIFFAGEEPEPTPRVRNLSQQQDVASGDIHSTA